MIAGENYGTPDLDCCLLSAVCCLLSAVCCLLVTPEVRETFVKALYCVISLLPAIAISLLPYYMHVAYACPATGVVGGGYKNFLEFMTGPNIQSTATLNHPQFLAINSPSHHELLKPLP